MVYTMSILFLGLIIGTAAVASNPSPHHAVLGLVSVAGIGCGILTGYGGSFLSLVLFLIYLGGMLVVFAYSAALAAEPYPESWGSPPVLGLMGCYLLGVGGVSSVFFGKWHSSFWFSVEEFDKLDMFRGEVVGVSLLYSAGGGLLAICAGVLLLTLFVVLEIVRGPNRGSLRAV